MDETHILVNFLEGYKGKKIKLFITNGYQLQGTLIDYDETHLEIQTDAYGRTKNVPVTIASVTTFVPW